MLNLVFLETGLGPVYPQHFVYDFSRLIFLTYSINGTNFVVLLPLSLEIPGHMCIVSICFPVDDVINFENILSSRFPTWPIHLPEYFVSFLLCVWPFCQLKGCTFLGHFEEHYELKEDSTDMQIEVFNFSSVKLFLFYYSYLIVSLWSNTVSL